MRVVERIGLGVALILTTALHAANTSVPSKLFKSLDGTFQFQYPTSLVLCQPQYEQLKRDTDLPSKMS
jgi:hypothetical protein